MRQRREREREKKKGEKREKGRRISALGQLGLNYRTDTVSSANVVSTIVDKLISLGV